MWNLDEAAAIEYCSGYTYHVVFDNGMEGDVDLGKHIESRPVFAPLRDLAYFRKARIQGGTICWPNGAQIPAKTLYEEVERAHKRREGLPESLLRQHKRMRGPFKRIVGGLTRARLRFKRFITRLTRAQLTVLSVASAICFLLLALHNPFGGYDTRGCYGHQTSWSHWTSENAVFRWIDEPSKALGLILPTVALALILS